MTDNVKHSTSYYHEAIAHAFEMFKNDYEPVMETPFQPRRLGSAFVTEYKPVRESLDEAPQLTIQQKWQIDEDLDAEFVKLLEQSEPLPKELLDRMQELRDKAEANRGREEALNELAAQSQELGMYDKDNGIFDRLVENIESAQSNPEGCVSTIVEVDNEQKLVYTREQLDDLYWTDLQEVGYKFGVKGRNRNKLTNAILQAQEKYHA